MLKISAKKPIISKEAALAILDRIDKIRRRNDHFSDYNLRAACAIVAEAAGYKDRTDWTNLLRDDPTSEYAKDYDLIMLEPNLK